VKNVPPEKMRVLEEIKDRLRGSDDPAVYRTAQRLTVEWLGECSGRTTIRDVELVSDEHAGSTGYGRGVSPAHTFLAGFAFSHMTQWGRSAAANDLAIDSLTEEIRASFDRRGEYLYDEGAAHPGFTDITFEVHLSTNATPEQVRAFIGWADRSPPHATLRRATRLVGIFDVNGRRFATAVYHADRTEWRYGE
jgi:uncharacterized OsmC-like protein